MTAFPRNPIFHLLSRGAARTGKEIEAVTGESRVTVTQKIATLMEAGLIVIHGHAASDGGRRARTYTINPHHRNLIGIDIGEKMARICLFDLSYGFLDERLLSLDLRADPEIALTALEDHARDLIQSPAATAPVVACGIGFPAPVDQRLGRVAAPSVMYGWEGLDLRRALRERLGLPVAIDNDVNLMCLAEYRLHRNDCRTFVFIKAGTGIGCGIINEGHLLRGAFGASGDIGHIQHTEPPISLCRCGKEGCVESQAAGWAIARDLTALGLPANDARDVMALYHRAEPECLKAINRSSRAIGTVAADLVAILNPDMIVLGGQLAISGEAMLAGIRERIYRKCLPLATERLQIRTGSLDERLGATGAAMLAMEHAMQ
ncbi:MAG: ROK family protein [Pseudorhodobacter sp.]